MAWWKWVLVSLTVTIVLGLGALYWLASQMGKASGEPAFFEDAIVAFEEADREAPPAPDGILFVGSSSIRLWRSLASDMAPLPVINRGFGGAHLEHVLHNLDRVVLPYAPRIVVVYAGDNDLAAGSGKEPARVLREYQELVARVHAKLPETHLYFLSIKPSKLRWERWPAMSEANAAVEAFSAGDERLHYVDLATPLLAGGEPRDDVFLFDGLHLNGTGYAAWTEVLRPLLVRAYDAR